MRRKSKKREEGQKGMSAYSDTFHTEKQSHNESPSTYMIQDRKNKEEFLRLTMQDRVFTAAMGGVLAEQEEPTHFKNVLDVACGTGGWAVATAQAYPTMSLVAIDISQSMIDYARAHAKVQGIAERITFQTMDALTLPGIAEKSFDLVNMRFGTSYLRVWEWPQLLRELIRVTRPGGIIRLTEVGSIHPCNSEALQKLVEMLIIAFHRSSHLFEQDPEGIIPHLPEFLAQQQCQRIQIQPHMIEYQINTTARDELYNSTKYLFRNSRPFLKKWGALSKNYETLYQQLLTDMNKPSFQVTINFATVWGQVPSS
jgi:ubiquinone/menaquinone biosynthesis C-methylase UbiE